MFNRSTFFLFLFCTFLETTLVSQNYQSIQEVNVACTQLGYIGNEESEIAVDSILDEIGLARNFMIIECPQINSAKQRSDIKSDQLTSTSTMQYLDIQTNIPVYKDRFDPNS